MLSKLRKGFTIIELMMVVAIISILLGIVVNVAQSSIKEARRHKASTVCTLVEQAFATYYAQYGKWPAPLGSMATSGSFGTENEYVLSRSEADTMVREVIREIKNGNPLMNISGLYVSTNNGEPRQERCPRHNGNVIRYYPAKGAIGMDFIEALRGTKQHPKKIKVSQMHFGYPHVRSGQFMPFRVVYNVQADTVSVEQWHWCD